MRATALRHRIVWGGKRMTTGQSPTIRECLIKALIAHGAKVVSTRSKKYEVYRLADSSIGYSYYFIGPSGALRRNTRSTYTYSVSLEGKPLREALVAEGRELFKRSSAGHAAPRALVTK